MSPIFVGLLPAAPGGLPGGRLLGADRSSFNDANGDGIIDLTHRRLSTTSGQRQRGVPRLRAARPRRRRSTASSRSSAAASCSAPSSTIAAGTWWTTRWSSSAASRCVNCRGLYDRTAPLEEQALAQATFLPGGGNSVAFLEPGWFIKLRELSLTFEAPDSWARAFRASRLSLTLAGRNLWTITDYTRRGPRGQRLRAGQLRVLGLRVPGAGALLDRAPQRRLLSRGRHP